MPEVQKTQSVEAPPSLKANPVDLANERAARTRFGLSFITNAEAKAAHSLRLHNRLINTGEERDKLALKAVRDQNPDLLGDEDPTASKVVANKQASREQRGELEAKTIHSLATARGEAYNINLPNNATLEDVITALQEQDANDLAAYIDRNVYFPSNVKIDIIQTVAQTFNNRSLREMHRAENGENTLRTVTYRRNDGKEFTVTLPKYHTARELVQILQSQGEHEVGKDGFYQLPAEPTFTKAVTELLQVEFTDLSDAIADIWKAIKKSFRQANGQNDTLNTN